MIQPRLLPTGSMARRLRVPVGWLRAEAEAGRVPCLKAGKVFLFDPGAVEDALIERARGRVGMPPPRPGPGFKDGNESDAPAIHSA